VLAVWVLVAMAAFMADGSIGGDVPDDDERVRVVAA
jgi:hypothetical protein